MVILASFILVFLISIQLTALPAKRPIKPIPAEEANPKLATKLQILEEKWDKNRVAARGYARTSSLPLKIDMVKVIIEPVAPGPESIDRKALKNRGGEIESISKSLMRVNLPVSRLTEITDQVEGISFIRTAYPYQPAKVNTSEGVEKTNANLYHNEGYFGQGVNVAIIDLGFDYLTEAINSGDISSSAITFTHDYSGSGLEQGIKHGTSVAEIVHDMAPQAELYLMKISDTTDLENAVDDAISLGVDIINHSVGWYNSNFYDGTGPDDWGSSGTNSADISAYARDNGILWINSAGNESQNHWQGDWYDPDEDNWLNFTYSNNKNYIGYVSEGSVIAIYTTWDAWPSDPEDYDLCLDRNKGGIWEESFHCSQDVQDGTQSPTEFINYTVPSGESADYYFSIFDVSAHNAPSIDLFAFVDNSGTINGQLVSSSSIITPSNEEKVLTVGGIDISDWSDGPQNSRSSLGPSNDSQHAFSRTKPDIMGPSCVSTYTYGISCGTSASAPHLAGAAALKLSVDPSLSANELQSLLEADAVDMGDYGMDNTYGWGRLELTAPVVKTDAIFRVDKQGNTYADGAYYGDTFVSGSADLAEVVQVTESVEPGDVLVLDPARPVKYRKSQEPYSRFIAGVVSTEPGLTLNQSDSGSETVMALVGTVPVKVTTKNGPIRPGDLLTTSSKSGYAMLCQDRSRCAGAIVGKALEGLTKGEGKIRVLLM